MNPIIITILPTVPPIIAPRLFFDWDEDMGGIDAGAFDVEVPGNDDVESGGIEAGIKSVTHL